MQTYLQKVLCLLGVGLCACGSEVIVVSSGGGGEGAGLGGGGAPASTGPAGGWDNVGACGGGLPGPPMVEIRRGDGSGYCVDSTEVTNEDWSVFYDHGRGPYASELCTGLPLEPVEEIEHVWRDPAYARRPFGFGTWCDYQAYCDWAGKRLCGGRDGALVTDDTPLEDHEWRYACTGGGEHPFPYGDTYEPDRCQDSTVSLDPTRDVASGTCEGGYPGLYDMVGNVAEAIRWHLPDSSEELGTAFLGGHAIDSEPSCYDITGTRALSDSGGGGLGVRCCRSTE